jgi:hypothetical protein
MLVTCWLWWTWQPRPVLEGWTLVTCTLLDPGSISSSQLFSVKAVYGAGNSLCMASLQPKEVNPGEVLLAFSVRQ